MKDMYTPGPWKWIRRDSWWNLMAGDVKVADDGSACGEYSPAITPNSANARLIAAAPDLLEAAKEALKALKAGVSTTSGWSQLVQKLLDEAIRKATGESYSE